MFAELSNYLDEQLDDSICEELERHLNGCEPCQAFLASLKALSNSADDHPQNPLTVRRQSNYARKFLLLMNV